MCSTLVYFSVLVFHILPFFVPRITVSVVSFSRLTLSLVPLKDYWLCGHSHTNQAQARCKTMSSMTGTDTDSTTSGCCRISELCRSAELSYWKYYQFTCTRLMRDFWVQQAESRSDDLRIILQVFSLCDQAGATVFIYSGAKNG